jgi:lipopolysaccharide/colanic/teichoic acid biosynthesis glycosyltransferase
VAGSGEYLGSVGNQLVGGKRVHGSGLAFRAGKRAFDIMFSLAVLVVTAPVVLVAAIAIRLDSPGPAFFLQERMGLGGRRFRLLKLRGMYVDSAQLFPHLYDYQNLDPALSDTSCVFRPDDDPRVTRVGRVLRKFSIDELPNFWNVLRGDLSVVGPRPEIPEVAHLYGADLPRLLSVRPGVTSPAKARHRIELSFDQTLALDLEYLERQSFWLDLVTITHTLANILRGGNSCARSG